MGVGGGRGGGGSSNFGKIRDSSCFGILRGSIFRIDLAIRLKGGRNPFFGPKLDPKAPKLLKIHISQTIGPRKLFDPQDDRKTYFIMGVLRYVYPFRQPEMP